MSDIIHGSCLCGGVRFEVRPPFIRANHCHCSRCRKHSGTAVCTQARVWREQFKLVQGESLIRVYGEGEVAVSQRYSMGDTNVNPNAPLLACGVASDVHALRVQLTSTATPP
jgi:hypothetical protein